MGAVNLDAKLFQPQPFGIADDANGGDHGVELKLLDLAVPFDMGGDLILGTVELLDCGLLHDGHALFFECLFGEFRNLFVFDRQHAVHHLDHGGIGAEGVVKARKFDSDSTGPDDQQFLGVMHRLQGVAIGPDAFAVRL